MRNCSTKIVCVKQLLKRLITAFHLKITAVVGSDFVKTICQFRRRRVFAAAPLLNLPSNTKTSAVYFREPFKAKAAGICVCVFGFVYVCRCWVGK